MATAPIEMPDNAAADQLRTSFLETAGSDRVTFAPGSAELTPKARFQLERQALWLSENKSVAVKFRSEAKSLNGVQDRGLATRRAQAVREYLRLFGVEPSQLLDVDVVLGGAGAVTTVIDPLRSAEPGFALLLRDVA